MMRASDQGGYGEKHPWQGFEAAGAEEIQVL